jgi:hypothetical protein
MGARLAVALVHTPVLDRRGDLVTTAVTNLDLHDIARSARTYGVERFYLVTPVAEQQRLVERILHHWRQGHGAAYNPDRGLALETAQIAASLEAALADWSAVTGEPAQALLTGARRSDGIPFSQARALLERQPAVLVLGTGWGLAPELFTRGWAVLEPLRGVGDYNHLSVRAAAAIMLDRLLGRIDGL